MTRVRPLVALWATSVGLTATILAPLLGGGDLLYRDAVSTPRSFVTDTALGLDGSPARAVPQDWFVAVVGSVADGHILDGSVVVIGLTFAALVLAGVGNGLLAAHVVPAARTPGALAAAVLAIWNPFVAERLLQGQWSLLLGYGALGWIVAAAHRCRVDPSRRSWAALASWSAVAGITPTGSLLAAAAVFAVHVVPTLLDRTVPGGLRLVRVVSAVAVAVVASLPWLVASLLTSAPATSDRAAVDAFAARAEPGLGTLGSLAGLGGIWNADAVPTSRTGMWALVAPVCLLAVLAAGALPLWRRRDRIPLLRSVVWLALVTLVLVCLAATGLGRAALGWSVATVPGAGLLRDSSKWVALLVPCYAVGAAFAVQAIGRWVPRGLAAAIAIGLVVLPLPDLGWGAGGSIRTVGYPRDWAAVADIVPADAGDVAVLPTGTNRRYAFTGGTVSLDPAARLLRAPVLATGELTVGGRSIDRVEDTRAATVRAALRRGAPPERLAQLGVGWVLVEATGPPAERTSRSLAGLAVVHRGPDLTLYRVPGPVIIRASATDRALAWTAHVIWLGVVFVGAVGPAVGFCRAGLGAGRRLLQWRT